MPSPHVILIVDDTPSQRRFYRRSVQSMLDPREWECLEADSLASGLQAVQSFKDRLAMALVDANLQDPPKVEKGRVVYDGLAILDQISRTVPRACYKVLVSRLIQDRKELAGHGTVDDFVHIRYQGDRNPLDELQDALRRGVDYILAQEPTVAR